MRFSFLPLTILTLILEATVSGEVRAGEVCQHWLAGPLHHQPEGLESDQIAFASTIWTPPSGGPTMLVVGGSFDSAGGVPVNYLAGWDGASWRDVGGGLSANGFVQSLAVYNGHLIVGGSFTAVGPGGSVPAMNIARYDGTTWHAMGAGLHGAAPGSAPHCYALTVYNGDLIAGGAFLNAGNQAAARVAKWNGTTWSAMGSGVGQPNIQKDVVRALRVHVDNFLYIGGVFQMAGGVAASNIVQFNGSTYAALASGVSAGFLDRVDALHSFGNELIAGGGFTTAGGIPVTNIARWIIGGEFGGAWATMGSGLSPSAGNGGVQALQPFNGQMVAGGLITGIVRAWNGSTWTTLGGGMTGGVLNVPRASTLNVFNGNLIAAGTFSTAGGAPATSIAQWNTSFWSALQAPTPQIMAFETFNSRLIAAGSFLQSTTTSTPANNIIGWDGATLTKMQNQFCCGEGTNGTIRALKSYTSATATHLVAGGDFTVAGSVTANRIAQYNQLQIFGSGWVALGAGFNNTVYAIERFNNATHAGGAFTQSGGTGLNRIARFDGTNWVALGSGMNGQVNAMKVFNGFLYAGGDFTTAGGVGTGCLARWNGTTWSTYSGLPGNILSHTVFALEVHNNNLCIGVQTGSSFHVVEYNGTTTPLVGTANGIISSLKSDGQHLYVLGGFTTIGGVSANRIARWNATNSWSDVEGGTNDVVNTLGLYRGEIQVGLGIFFGLDDEGAGDVPENPAPQPGKGWVRYSPTATAWVATNPSGQSVTCNQTATFSAQPAQGYSLLLASWQKNGVFLNDGPTGHGSTISGAHASTLIITGARTFDAGAYSCTFASLCGAATSSAATLTVNNCCNPDLDGNAFVNVDDLLAVINQWGPCPTPPAMCLADVAPAGGNGFVNVDDMLVVINGWGACP